MEIKTGRESIDTISGDTIPQIFRSCVENYGEKTALRYKKYGIWKDITWNEYYNNVEYIALALESMGMKKGDCVSIIGDNCYQWVMIDMAALTTGAISVGIYSTSASDQCEYIINHSESKFFFVENEEQLDKWMQFRDKSPTLEKVIVWELKGLRDFEDPMVMTFDDLLELGKKLSMEKKGRYQAMMDEVKPEDDGLIIYTSGTTGQPKGAVLTHKNAVWIANSNITANPVYLTDEVLSYLPLCHVFERIFSVFSHIRFGYTVNFMENLDTIIDNMREVSPTVGYSVPRIWEKYYSNVIIRMSDATLFKKLVFKISMKIGQKYTASKETGTPSYFLKGAFFLAHLAVFRKLKERLGFERLRVAFSGAAPIAPDVLRAFNSIGMPLLEGYGQTEGTGVTTVNRLEKPKIGTVGKPLQGVEIRISDDGEILMKSPGMFKGYHKDPETTAQTIRDGWLHTGDTGRMDEDGNLIITGRLKDIIITAGGKNISPQYVESKIIFSPYVSDVVVIGDGKAYLTAIIVLDEENAVKYAQDNKIQFSTYGDLAVNPDIAKLIQQEIDEVNEHVSRVEQIKKFSILPHKLYEEEGDVTPTMKVKRNYITKKYSDIIERMYR